MVLSPLLILVIGVAVVIGMIMFLRINAFIALITAAIVVSLLSPGVGAEKISRVAEAFGATVGGVGIVIALAAIIGKCLMDSGAADRIVRSFLKAVGEERAPIALMGSGFLLSVPVFFDTVFYLLVPLARSLWLNKRKNYILYITAIVAGGAVTHSMVPPTPGPLGMAAFLEIDLGLMMFVGAMVGLPMSIVGLGVCWFLNRRMPLDMRPYAGAEEPTPIEDSKLPPLWISLLPVVLPVVLIAANTVAMSLAPSVPDETDLAGLANLVSDFVSDVTPAETDGGNAPDLATLITPITESAEAEALLVEPEAGRSDSWNRLLAITGVLGNPNFALLVSATICLYLVARYRGDSLLQLSDGVEHALMSGGVVILITAAGGAFGKMLKEAGIQSTIESWLGQGGSIPGSTVLLAGFSVAMLMKFAQGSGTVSMLTTSSMFAAMQFSDESLGFNIVYLATAIGSGSLVGDWMNNSGFWVFSKMSVLTTSETLKTWTFLTACLGVTGLVVTLIASKLLPLL